MRPNQPSLAPPLRICERHALRACRTPAAYFALRLQRLQYFSLARLGHAVLVPPDGAAEDDAGEGRRLRAELARRLAALPALDPDLFVAADVPAGPGRTPEDEARIDALAGLLPPGLAVEDAAVFRHATLDGSMRAIYEALRHLHVVAVGPPWLIELAGGLRLDRFTLRVASGAEAGPARRERLERMHEEHRRFRGEPVAYLFHAGESAPWWVLELHGRLRNAFLLDLGPVLETCLPERVLRAGWGRIHWRAVARHLGLDAGPREDAPGAALRPPRPAEAPGRARPARRAPAVERRAAWRRLDAGEASGAPTERLREGDLERCLRDVLVRAARG